MKYRVGWPFWKLIYKLGFTLSYRYEIFYDIDCKRYIGVSHDVRGLIAECDTVKEIRDVIESNAPEVVACQIYGPDFQDKKINSLTAYVRYGEGLVHG